MTEFSITRGKTAKAVKVVLYGIEGIGKSTFASQFPNPVFIDTEGSTAWMDVDRLPSPTSWEMLLSEIGYIIDHPDVCKTLVIDTVDWAEALAIRHVCSANGKSGIEDFGYGNGYTYVKETFGRLLNGLDLVAEKGINVVLTAHAAIRTFTKPDEMGTYDRYELKLINTPKVKLTEMVKEWCDMLMFANYKTILVKASDKDKKSYAAGGERKMYTQHAPSYDAKNRFGLPEELPFEYAQIAHVVAQIPSTRSETKKTEEDIKVTKSRSTEAENKPVVMAEDIPPAMDDTEERIIASLPKALADLLKANKVLPSEIQKVVGLKGYFPADMPINEYPLDFVEQVLVGAWTQVFDEVKIERRMPY